MAKGKFKVVVHYVIQDPTETGRSEPDASEAFEVEFFPVTSGGFLSLSLEGGKRLLIPGRRIYEVEVNREGV